MCTVTGVFEQLVLRPLCVNSHTPGVCEQRVTRPLCVNSDTAALFEQSVIRPLRVSSDRAIVRARGQTGCRAKIAGSFAGDAAVHSSRTASSRRRGVVLAVVRSAAVWQLSLQSFGVIFQLIFARKGSRKEENKGFTEAVGRNERLELCGDGAQAHQCDSLLCRQLHKPSGAQPHHRVSYSHYYYDCFVLFWFPLWLCAFLL